MPAPSVIPAYGQGFGLQTNFATLLPPGGRVVAYVGTQSDATDQYAQSGLLVSSLSAALAKCRSGIGDTIVLLPGYAETFTGNALSGLVAGTRIVGAGTVGGASSPTINLSGTGAGLLFNVADVVFCGVTVLSSTAAVTGAVVVSAGGVNIVNNCFRLTGALAGNIAFQIGAAPNFVFAGNYVSVNSTTNIVNFSSASATEFFFSKNYIRQSQGTGGGAVPVNVANVAATGVISDNYVMNATNLGAGASSTQIVIGAAALPGVGTFQNFCSDGEGGAGISMTPANDNT